MLAIAVRSQNEFHKLGLLNIIEKIVQSEEVTLSHIDSDEKSRISESVNVIFTDQIAIVNIFELKKTNKQEEIYHPQATIHVTFNTDSLFIEEIKALVSKIISLSRMNYKQLIQNEFFRKIMSRNGAQLSTKESRVVMLIGQGYDTINISKILNCSQSTIYTHRRNAIRKLGMVNRLQFYKYTLLLKEFCYRENIFLCL